MAGHTEFYGVIWAHDVDNRLEVFILRNLVLKSLQKIRFENIQNRRPHGSSITHGGFEISYCVEPLWMARVQTFLSKFDES